MEVKITPKSLKGCLEIIPSKSHGHRSLIAAALGDKAISVILKKTSEDIEATINCLRALGSSIKTIEDGFYIEPIKKLKSAPTLNCRESGTTLRLLMPVAASLYEKSTFLGEGRLPKRPLEELLKALEEGGCSHDNNSIPLTLTGRLKSGSFLIPGNVSSQYISGLLFALPLLDEDSEIILTTPLQSVSYVHMTIETLKDFNIEIETTEKGYRVRGGQKYSSPSKLIIEGDWSNGAFYLAAGALGKEISLRGLNLSSSQGDKKITELLKGFGALVRTTSDYVKVSPSKLKAIEIDVSEIPDLLPILAVIASKAEGRTVLKNAARLRLKESDRLKTTSAMLKALGGDVLELPDSLVIQGKPYLEGGVTDSFGDHRIAMAAAIASIMCKNPVTIRNAQATAKSYPSFFEDFKNLGGAINVFNAR